MHQRVEASAGISAPGMARARFSALLPGAIEGEGRPLSRVGISQAADIPVRIVKERL